MFSSGNGGEHATPKCPTGHKPSAYLGLLKCKACLHTIGGNSGTGFWRLVHISVFSLWSPLFWKHRLDCSELASAQCSMPLGKRKLFALLTGKTCFVWNSSLQTLFVFVCKFIGRTNAYKVGLLSFCLIPLYHSLSYFSEHNLTSKQGKT